MKNLKEVQEIIKKENINFYNVGLSSEVLINGNDMFNIENFIDFVHSQKINAVFGCELFEYAEDYLITDEIIESQLGRYTSEEILNIIIDDIDKYNKKVCEVNFDVPFLYVVACLYEGHYFYIKVGIDRGIDETFLIEPEKKIQEIIKKNEKNIENMRQEKREIIEQLKNELKGIIVNDEKFSKCSNRTLRTNYIKELLYDGLNEHFEPLKKLWISDTIKGLYQDPIDFIEILWREINKQ